MLWVLLPLQKVAVITQLSLWALELPLLVPLYKELSH